MSIVYTWPVATGWKPSRFEMRVVPNALSYTSALSKSTQAIAIPGDRWKITLDLPATDNPVLGAAWEAFFDRLDGPVNLVQIGHLRRRTPQGSMRDTGGPTVYAAVAQLANIAVVQTTAFATLLAGDHLSLAGQMVRTMADAVADSSGRITIEFKPRARAAMAAGAAVSVNYPTANFRQPGDGTPIVWRPGIAEGISVELIEDL